MSILGKLLYSFYYKPKSRIDKLKRYGGFNNTRLVSISEKEMKEASLKLLIEKPQNNLQELTVYFMTGQKYWYQTIFCAYSLQKSTQYPFKFIFLDDGTMDQSLENTIKKSVPNSEILLLSNIRSRISKTLPVMKYPTLNHKRQVYPHIRKLTDLHSGSKGWKLLLDSDMLFFQEPKEMIEWLKNPEKPFFMQDTINSYHYSFDLMKSICGETVREKLNVGMIGLKSEDINFDLLEKWTNELESKAGSSYYLEQALSAMIVGQKPVELANKEQYKVLPSKEEVISPTVILHHYVAESKEWYLKKAWRHFYR